MRGVELEEARRLTTNLDDGRQVEWARLAALLLGADLLRARARGPLVACGARSQASKRSVARNAASSQGELASALEDNRPPLGFAAAPRTGAATKRGDEAAAEASFALGALAVSATAVAGMLGAAG